MQYVPHEGGGYPLYCGTCFCTALFHPSEANSGKRQTNRTFSKTCFARRVPSVEGVISPDSSSLFHNAHGFTTIKLSAYTVATSRSPACFQYTLDIASERGSRGGRAGVQSCHIHGYCPSDHGSSHLYKRSRDRPHEVSTSHLSSGDVLLAASEGAQDSRKKCLRCEKHIGHSPVSWVWISSTVLIRVYK